MLRGQHAAIRRGEPQRHAGGVVRHAGRNAALRAHLQAQREHFIGAIVGDLILAQAGNQSLHEVQVEVGELEPANALNLQQRSKLCLLYTSDAADE